jgi:hypothetical protein
MKAGENAGTKRRAVCWLVCSLLFCTPLARTQQSAVDSSTLRGRELFTGQAALQGRISTHEMDLPPAVVRCANCHAEGTGSAVARSNAPRLDREWLLSPQRRRGGPPSHYDRDSFCRVLRKGVDPAWVVINEEMPRYTVDDADCSALWRFLTEDLGDK